MKFQIKVYKSVDILIKMGWDVVERTKDGFIVEKSYNVIKKANPMIDPMLLELFEKKCKSDNMRKLKRVTKPSKKKFDVKHIVEEGARFHVISYDDIGGAYCSEPNCEKNEAYEERKKQKLKEKEEA